MREARAAGLRHDAPLTLEAIERRRSQLSTLALILLAAVAFGVALMSWAAGDGTGSARTSLSIAILLAPLGFGAYAIEKELHLRRLSRSLIEERTRTEVLESRLDDTLQLLKVSKAVNAELELPVVLETILGSAIEVLSAAGGSVMLLDAPEQLVTVIARGGGDELGRRVMLGQGIAGRAADDRVPVLVNTSVGAEPPSFTIASDPPAHSVVAVPLISRGVLLGVLTAHAPTGRTYTEVDRQTASLFGEQAACAIANARLYEQQRGRASRAEIVVGTT